MEKKYIKKFKEYITENEGYIDIKNTTEENNVESNDPTLSDVPEEVSNENKPIVDEQEEKGLSNKSNLSS